MPVPAQITEIETLDTARILNQDENDWEKGWLRVYKRHKHHELADVETVDSETKETKSIHVAPYTKFELLIGFTVVGSPTSLRIKTFVSTDNATWYLKTDGPFGDLSWGAPSGTTRESIIGECVSEYMKFELIADGTSYSVDLDIVLIS